MNVKRSLVFTLALWLTVSAASFVRADEPEITLPEKENFHLYLLIGQSNMAGRGKVEEVDKKPHPRVLMLTKKGSWQPAVDPLHSDKPSAGVGLGSAFGRAMAEASPDVTIGLLPCAVGGTPLERWEEGKDLYAQAVRRAMPTLKQGTLKGILWHQGEADSFQEETALSYGKRLTGMIAALRSELDAEEVPFVAGELGHFLDEYQGRGRTLGYWKVVNEQLAGLKETVPGFALVSAAGLKHKGDKVHFDSAALRTFGQRYSSAMLKLQGKATNDAK